MTTQTLAIVGASLAGAKAAESARNAGFDGRIVLIGDEPAFPYERPPLSKEILRGESKPSEARVHPDGFYADNDIEVVLEAATMLDVLRRRIELESERSVYFDTAILATGSAPRRLTSPGADLPGVFSLRTLDDAMRLRAALRGAKRAIVVGAGWIGSEVAASASQMGVPVTLVDPAPVPLRNVVGERIGGVFRDLHKAHGVDLRLGCGVTSIAGTEHVEGVVLDDGTIVRGDVVVVGIGITPRTRLAEEAVGLRVSNGIVVDEHLETNVEGIFAAGDVANAWHPHFNRRLRVEHWANALNQGETAGRNAVGARDEYRRLPYFFSDQYDLGLEYVGHHEPGDELVVQGDLDAREFIAFWQRDGSVTGALMVNVWNVIDDVKRLIEERVGAEEFALAH